MINDFECSAKGVKKDSKMSNDFFVSGSDGTLGPFSKKNLQKLLENGRITPESQCWIAGQFNNKTSVKAVLQNEALNKTQASRTITGKSFKTNQIKTERNNIFLPDIGLFDKFLSNKNLIKFVIGSLIAFFALICGLCTIVFLLWTSYTAKNAVPAAAYSLMIYPSYVFFLSMFFGGLKIKDMQDSNFEVIPIVIELFDLLAKSIALFIAFCAPSFGLFTFEYQKSITYSESFGLAFILGILTPFGVLFYAILSFIVLKALKEFTMIIFSIAMELSLINKSLSRQSEGKGNI
jgi:hypothetical protein